MIQVCYIYCAHYFYYYCISSTSDHQALDPGSWGPHSKERNGNAMKNQLIWMRWTRKKSHSLVRSHIPHHPGETERGFHAGWADQSEFFCPIIAPCHNDAFIRLPLLRPCLLKMLTLTGYIEVGRWALGCKGDCRLPRASGLTVFTSHCSPWSFICQVLGAISAMKTAVWAPTLFSFLFIIFD